MILLNPSRGGGGLNSAPEKQYAFTLAEVLITLGIIGIVAAMTLPALIQKQEKISILTSLKKSYSELQNVVNLISNEYGEDIGKVVEQLDDVQAKELFMKYFDNAIDCTENSCYDANKITYYKYNGTPLGNRSDILNTNYYFNEKRFITKDGRLIVFGGTNQNGRMISVDVNGPFKNPNSWGRDVFTFRVMDRQIIPCGGREDYSCLNMGNYNCNESDTSQYSGIGCTYYALTKKGFLEAKYYYKTFDRFAK